MARIIDHIRAGVPLRGADLQLGGSLACIGWSELACALGLSEHLRALATSVSGVQVVVVVAVVVETTVCSSSSSSSSSSSG